MKHKLSIDFEEYFQPFQIRNIYPIESWSKEISRIEIQTNILLKILNSSNTKATFFVVGWIADNFPNIIEKIASDGHEIGSHSYWHNPIFNLTEDKFKEDIELSQNAIYKAINYYPVIFRAPNFSIRKDNLWSLKILKDFGFKYDSSVHNIQLHSDYGVKYSFSIDEFEKAGLIEFPITVFNGLGFNMPFAGGAYFRYYPYSLTETLFHFFQKNNQSILFYFHPWELDKNLPNFNSSTLTKLRLTYNIHKNMEKLEKLINTFEFESINSNVSDL